MRLKKLARPLSRSFTLSFTLYPFHAFTTASAEMTRIRTELKLNDMDTVRHRDEIGDGQMSAVQVFPGVMVQQHANTLAMRSFIPKSAGQVEVS